MYACSPRWSNHWISIDDLSKVLSGLAKFFPRGDGSIRGVNYGLHLTGGEPFLNFDLLLRGVEIAEHYGLRAKFVETNCFWCRDMETVRERLRRLKDAGLDGMLISVNPFVIEHVPFENIERGIRGSIEIFGVRNTLVYHPAFYEQLTRLNIRGKLSFEDYLAKMLRTDPEGITTSFSPYILLPMGRLPYRLGHLYRRHPARRFLGYSCLEELTRPWHIHVDCYCNYIPGYCAGISLGDARKLDEIIQGVELDDRPILEALAKGLHELYRLAVEEYGYRELKEGYISKCHLCLDIRRHIVMNTDEYKELQPREFYYRL